MYQGQINVRYAKALILLAKEQGKLEYIKNDAEFILTSVNNSSEFNLLLEHPVIKPSEKIKAFEALFKSNVNELTVSFLKLLIKNKREIHLKRILQNLIDIYKKEVGIKPVVITTAYALNDVELTQVKTAIEQKTNSSIELTDNVDDSIIGGLILQIEDKELDVSVRNQLHKFKLNLIDFDLNSKKRKII